MKMLSVPLLVVSVGVMAGCTAGPASAQPDPVITRLDRLDARFVDAAEDSALLRREMSDNRFESVTDAMTAGFRLLADTLETGFQLVTDKMKEYNDQRVVDNTRVEARITALEEAAAIPWWIIGSMCVGAPVVGGGGWVAGNMRGKKTSNGNGDS